MSDDMTAFDAQFNTSDPGFGTEAMREADTNMGVAAHLVALAACDTDEEHRDMALALILKATVQKVTALYEHADELIARNN